MDAQSRAQDQARGPLTDRPSVPRQGTDPAIGGDWGDVQDPVADEHNAMRWEQHHPDDHEGFGRIRGFQRQGGALAPTNRHRGRASSWIVVVLGCVGFALGGISLAMGWALVPLVLGAAMMAAAVIIALACDILTDVVLDSPRDEAEEAHQTPLHRIKSMMRRERKRERKAARATS